MITSLIRIQLPSDWAEFVAHWFAMGLAWFYLFRLIDEIPSTAIFWFCFQCLYQVVSGLLYPAL